MKLDVPPVKPPPCDAPFGLPYPPAFELAPLGNPEFHASAAAPLPPVPPFGVVLN